MLAITGQVGTPVIGTDAFQETPIVEVCRSVTKHHYLVTRVEDVARVLREAGLALNQALLERVRDEAEAGAPGAES